MDGEEIPFTRNRDARVAMKPDSSSASGLLRIRLSAAGERSVRSGHPWVYESSVREQNRAGTCGELVVIYDRQDRFAAIGLFDPDSPIRIRILHQGSPQKLDDAWWSNRLSQAIERRHGLFDSSTTGYRLINGESDGWPGLVLDNYGDCLVLKLYTAVWLPRFDSLIEMIREQCKPGAIVLRLSRNIQGVAEQQFQLQDGAVAFGELKNNPVVFRENALLFEADVIRGQKTGFFLDQRENRKLVGEMCEGKTVLNAFSFSGGFSLYAARAGAVSVTDLDISSHALESSKRNQALNVADSHVNTCARQWVQGDTFEWLASCGLSFDVIILDPPSLAKREGDRAAAIHAYEKLARLAAPRVNSGGLLACFSCSAHVTDHEFYSAVLRGIAWTPAFRMVAQTGHAADHPAAFAEAKYLKGIYLRRI